VTAAGIDRGSPGGGAIARPAGDSGELGPRRLDYLALGHVTVDVGPDGSRSVGGGATFAAATAADLGLAAAVVTRVGRDDLPDGALRRLDAPSGAPRDSDATRCILRPSTAGASRPIPCRAGRDRRSTTFEHAYDLDGARRSRLLARAARLAPSDVPPEWRSTGVAHVAPVADELPPGMLAGIAAEFVGATPQGWLRTLEPGSVVAPGRWSAPDDLIGACDAVVLSDEDLDACSGRLEWLVERVPLVVETRGARGAWAHADGRVVHQPALLARLVDPTGAGDTFAAALFVRLWEGAALEVALRFAAAAAACRVETRGLKPLPPREVIERRAAGAA